MKISFTKHIAPHLVFLVAFAFLFIMPEPMNFAVFYACFFLSILAKNWER